MAEYPDEILENIFTWMINDENYRTCYYLSKQWYQVCSKMVKSEDETCNHIWTIYQKFPDKFPSSYYSTALGQLERNPNLTLEQYDSLIKDQQYFTYNPSITWDYIENHKHYNWNFNTLGGVSNLLATPKTEWQQEKYNKIVNSLSTFAILTPGYTVAENDKTNLSNMPYLQSSINITIRFIINNPDVVWQYDSLSYNPNITWEFIQSHINKNWNWSVLSSHPCITWDLVVANPQIAWDYKE